MAQRFRALTALLKILSSNPSNHMVGGSQPPTMRSGALVQCVLQLLHAFPCWERSVPWEGKQPNRLELWCFIQKTLVLASHFILKRQSGNPARIERETMSSKTKRKNICLLSKTKLTFFVQSLPRWWQSENKQKQKEKKKKKLKITLLELFYIVINIIRLDIQTLWFTSTSSQCNVYRLPP